MTVPRRPPGQQLKRVIVVTIPNVKFFATITIILFGALQLSAQQTLKPAFRLISLDSLQGGDEVFFPKTIKLKSDSFSVIYKSKQYTFTIPSTDNSLSDPEAFTAAFDNKNYLAVSRWEIMRMRVDTIEFNVTWSKRGIRSGAQKGSYFTAPVNIARSEIPGAYYATEDKPTRRTGNSWSRIAMIGMVACFAIIAGSQ